MAAECVSQCAGVSHDIAEGVDGRERNQAFLQIDDDKGGLRVNDGNTQEARLPVF
jgi:hypothetical protein